MNTTFSLFFVVPKSFPRSTSPFPRRSPSLPSWIASHSPRSFSSATRLQEKKSAAKAKTTSGVRENGHNLTKRTRFLFRLEEFLASRPTSKQIDHFVHRQLDEMFSSPELHDICRRVMTSLQRHGYLEEAMTVYERMQKYGFIPSIQSQAEMLVIALAAPDPDPKVLEALTTLLQSSFYTDDEIVQLLETMEKAGIPYEILNQLGNIFFESRPDGYLPGATLLKRVLYFKARAGFLDDALTYMRKSSSSSSSSSSSPIPSPSGQFAKILQGVSEVNPADQRGIDATLETMEEVHVQPDVAVLNALISRELRRRSLNNAFSLYHAIIRYSKLTSVSPDASTFGILFSALYKLFKPAIHAVRASTHESKVIPPRQLYRDMLFFLESSPFPMSPTLLNGALRSFLRTQDYAGAYVVLRSFRIFRMPVTTGTYRFVMDHIMRRIFWDAKSVDVETTWVDRFLGIKSKYRRQQKNDSLASQASRAMILFSASKSQFSLTECLLETEIEGKLERIYQNPTCGMIDGRENSPEPANWSVVPLQRILCRAIAATNEQNDHQLASSYVSSAIHLAKRDMFPGTEHPYQSD